MSEDIKSLRVPTFCPLCGFLMKGKSTNTFYNHGVCVNCFIHFIDGRESKWKSGWRPDDVELEAYKVAISRSSS